MQKTLSGTKRVLVDAAGELFAQHGMEGTSVRAIAEKANANIAAVNYHFGSKENLYTEVLRHVITSNVTRTLADYAAQIEASESVEEMMRIVGDIITDRFTTFFSNDDPEWHGKLLMRSLLEPSPSLQRIVDQVFAPEHRALERAISRICPGMTALEAQLMAFSLSGQIAFYVLARTAILIFLGKKNYDTAFLDAAREHVSRIILAGIKDYNNGGASPAGHEKGMA